MPLQLCGICLYSLSYTSAFFPKIVTISQVLADRTLRNRLRQVEHFSEDGLPFKNFNMRSTKELFENYIDTPKALTVNELVHLKLIAISLNHFFKKRGVKASRKELQDTFFQIYRLLLSLSYVPTLAQLQAQNQATSKKSQR